MQYKLHSHRLAFIIQNNKSAKRLCRFINLNKTVDSFAEVENDVVTVTKIFPDNHVVSDSVIQDITHNVANIHEYAAKFLDVNIVDVSATVEAIELN